MAIARQLPLLLLALWEVSCSFHPRPGQTITVRGWYNSKMFSYFIPAPFPEERWSLAGDGGFTMARIRVFTASKDSLKHLYGTNREDILEASGMWMEVIVRGKISSKGQFCKHVDCPFQLDLEDVRMVRPAHRNPEK
ncbi:MAG: hypothetical protein JNN12_16555 [Bacteroidetes Order II. Incertae sedis bacterium]|nr:hypothetical protein [Bacteroidetes Order II. bacterium]